jgi:hypothetical protein
VHAFRALGDRPARMLILNAPGRMHADFFTGIGTPLPDGATDLPAPSAPDIPEVIARAGAVGMTILAPA